MSDTPSTTMSAAPTDSPSQGSTPSPAPHKSGDCFRDKFSGIYQTLPDIEPGLVPHGFVKIHDGPCQCEGQTALDCPEPGDPDT